MLVGWSFHSLEISNRIRKVLEVFPENHGGNLTDIVPI
jgi:hypothetical protein